MSTVALADGSQIKCMRSDSNLHWHDSEKLFWQSSSAVAYLPSQYKNDNNEITRAKCSIQPEQIRHDFSWGIIMP